MRGIWRAVLVAASVWLLAGMFWFYA